MKDVQTSLERMKEMADLDNKEDDSSLETNAEVTENIEVIPEDTDQNQEETQTPDTNTTTETGQGSDESAVSTMQEMSEDIYIVRKGDTLAKISKKEGDPAGSPSFLLVFDNILLLWKGNDSK